MLAIALVWMCDRQHKRVMQWCSPACLLACLHVSASPLLCPLLKPFSVSCVVHAIPPPSHTPRLASTCPPIVKRSWERMHVCGAGWACPVQVRRSRRGHHPCAQLHAPCPSRPWSTTLASTPGRAGPRPWFVPTFERASASVLLRFACVRVTTIAWATQCLCACVRHRGAPQGLSEF